MWQLFLFGYFIFGTSAYISRRMLMLHKNSSSRLFNLIFWLVFFMPSGWIAGLLLPHTLTPGWVDILLMFVGAIFWPIVGLVGFRANKEVDTGFYAIMNNLAPLITLLIAVTLLHEALTVADYLGILLLVLSGIIVAIPLLRKGTHASRLGFFFCCVTILAGGCGAAYERVMLTRVGLGTYMIYAWTFQAIWVVLFAWRELPQVVQFFKKADSKAKKLMTIFGLTNVIRTMCFQVALLLSGSAAIVSAATNFMAVTVLFAAYIILSEKEHLNYKIAAVVVGILGLLLVGH